MLYTFKLRTEEIELEREHGSVKSRVGKFIYRARQGDLSKFWKKVYVDGKLLGICAEFGSSDRLKLITVLIFM